MTLDLKTARTERVDAAHRAAEGRVTGRELTTLAVYFFLVVAVSDILNVRLGVELLTVVVLVAAVAITRRPALFARDWSLYLIGLIMWNLSGAVAAGSPFPWHLSFMLNVDRFLFAGHQPVVVLQHALTSPDKVSALDVLTSLVYNLHLPEPYIAGYFLWRLNRPVFAQFAASVLVLLVLGFVTFIVFPAVPPWMASQRFHALPGVINRFGPTLKAHPLPFHGTPIFYLFHLRGDPVAAFPSEHAALPMLELLAFGSALGRRAWPFAIWVLLVLFAILYLGEHWFTDALAGWIYAGLIFAAVRHLARRCEDSSAMLA